MSTRRSTDPVLLAEYSELTGEPRSTAYLRARCGELPFRLRAGRWEMNRAVFDRLLEQLRREGKVRENVQLA